MQQRVKPRRRAVNLSVDRELLDAARAAGVNLSAVLDRALRDELLEARWEAWRRENKAAIEASNRELAERGLWADDYRVW